MYGRPHFEVSDGYGAGDAAYGMNRGLGMGAGAPGAGINPSMLNSAGSGMGFTDEELLESLMSDSNGGMGSVPMHQQSSVGNDQTMGVSQPLRSLPRHLDTSSPFAFNSPVSPSDIYSPGSASTSAADSFFRDREGSFSAGDEVPLPGVPGKDGASFDRSRSGKVPSSRARAGRRSSTSMSRTDSLQPPGSIPAGSLTGYASIGYQSTSRPQAASVPTYLSTMSHHLGSPNGWTSSSPMGQHAPSFDPSMLQGGFYPGLANGSQIGAASADSGARNGVSRDIHRLKNGFAPSSAPVSRTAIARLPDASPAGESDDPQYEPLTSIGLVHIADLAVNPSGRQRCSQRRSAVAASPTMLSNAVAATTSTNGSPSWRRFFPISCSKVCRADPSSLWQKRPATTKETMLLRVPFRRKRLPPRPSRTRE